MIYIPSNGVGTARIKVETKVINARRIMETNLAICNSKKERKM